MPSPLLRTKTYIPPLGPALVSRPRLIARLNEGLTHKLSLISAPAGSGKTTLLSEWVRHSGRPVAWLSLDEGDNDPARFLAYLIAALQTVHPDVGKAARVTPQSPQASPSETVGLEQSVLTALINEIAALPIPHDSGGPCILVLDDYHLITTQPIHDALIFLLQTHFPPAFAEHLDH